MAANGNSGTQVPNRPRAGFKSSEPLPTTIPELTPEWFSKALQCPVKSVTTGQEIHGTASKVLVELEYHYDNNDADNKVAGSSSSSSPSATPLPPSRLCVKGGFHPAIIKAHPELLPCYRVETHFYYHLAPQISNMTLPRVLYTGTDVVTGQGLLIMDDMTTTPPNTTFGSVLEPWPVKRVQKAVRQLALLHAATWACDVVRDFPWYGMDDKALGIRDMISSLWTVEHWREQFFNDDKAARPPVHESLLDRERVLAAWQTLWYTTDSRFMAMVHGDSHVNNTFILSPSSSSSGAEEKDERPGFLDWQGLHPNSAFHDVAYFISGSLDTEDRRRHEKQLLQDYLDTLAEAGGPRFTMKEVWDEYRRQQIHGFVWALVPAALQPREIVHTFSRRHAAAIMDHGSLELLEANPRYRAWQEKSVA